MACAPGLYPYRTLNAKSRTYTEHTCVTHGAAKLSRTKSTFCSLTGKGLRIFVVTAVRSGFIILRMQAPLKSFVSQTRSRRTLSPAHAFNFDSKSAPDHLTLDVGTAAAQVRQIIGPVARESASYPELGFRSPLPFWVVCLRGCLV